MKRQSIFALFTIISCLLFQASASAQTIVCINTNLGQICMQLLQSAAPQTTQAFLNYVDTQTYDKTLIHSAQRGTNNLITGGRYKAQLPTTELAVPKRLPNEQNQKNLRGTVAMTVLGTDANSAGTQWFINASDNPALDTGLGQSGTVGTTVFARVIGNGMKVVDTISRLPVFNVNSAPLALVPVVTMDKSIGAEDLVVVQSITRYPGTLAEYEAALSAGDVTTTNPANLTDVVCLDTNQGEFCIKMYTEDAPATVANFLSYARGGDYDNTILHRSIPGFVIQGGGFSYDAAQGAVEVPKKAKVVNEYKRSNTYATLAMAKLDGDPDSATSEWFINLDNNSGNLDNQNGGFTVFAGVVGTGMSVIQKIASLPVYDISSTLGGPFTNVPVTKLDTPLAADNFVTINRVYETQRDTSIVDDALDPNDPVSYVTALAKYGTASFVMPVRINNNLYQFIFNEKSVSPPVYTVDTTHIIQLKDTGRPAASFNFNDNRLLIPSIRIGSKVYTNIELTLTNREILEFTLVSFDKL